jgi:hypothetical protein
LLCRHRFCIPAFRIWARVVGRGTRISGKWLWDLEIIDL